jgi:MATE family multidrug resistance protein
VSSRAESLSSETAEEGRSSERFKRPVAHGADTACEGRPNLKSGTFVQKPSLRRELFQLAWPIAAGMLGETAIGLVDTKLVGGLGPAALGGVGLATTVMYLCYSLTFGAMRGVKVRAAHAIGEGNGHDAYAYARAGLVMGLGFGVVVMIACRDVSPLLLRLGADPEIVPYARDFLAAVTLGAPATCGLSALIQHRQGTGDSRTPMVVGIAGNAFNALLAWGLIYGRFGLPALGAKGAGYSTATTEMLELLVMVWLLVRDERLAEKSRVRFPSALREVADLGIPTGIQFTAEMLAFTLFTLVLSSISKEEIAANQIALNVIRVSFLPGIAVAEATSVLVGRALGARSLAEADAATRNGLALATAFMATCGLVFATTGAHLGRFFSSDTLVIDATRRLFYVAAVFQVLDAVNIVLRGALRGAKDVRVVAVIGILVVWSFLPTSAYVLGKLCGLGALGAWLGFIGETTLGATLFWLRWRRGSWRANYES